MKVTIPVEAGNAAFREGRLQQLMSSQLERLKPEAAYFYPADGERTALLVIDLKDPSDLPFVSEPFFSGVNARVEFFPVMNADDLRKGLQRLASQG
jgi:hypothetical protein